MRGWITLIKRVAQTIIRRKPNWAIGMYTGPSPWSLQPPADLVNPVLTAQQVTDIPADFVADPFMLRVDGVWHLFFEALNLARNKGEIGWATSVDGWDWHYQKIVLREAFHLSYPYVFQVQDQFYLIPETYEDASVRLYRATQFPDQWELVKVLLDDRDYVDTSIVYFQDFWWLFSSIPSSDQLYLHFAPELTGHWVEHPHSPVIQDNPQIARPGGRVFLHVFPDGQHLIRYAQNDATVYGQSVSAWRITRLTPQEYTEEPIGSQPILQGTGRGWNGLGMHHIDPHVLDNGQWIACVDGYDESFVWRWGGVR